MLSHIIYTNLNQFKQINAYKEKYNNREGIFR